MEQITIPHQFQPRDYQLPILKALDSGYKRAIQVWNRRSGKDKVDFNYMVKEAMSTKAQYYYFFPTYTQGKKALWDNIDNNGFKMLDHVPQAVRTGIDNTLMQIRLTSGSIIQVVGVADIDSVVGTNPRGCVFSEYSLQDPRGWQFVRPILASNGGWAIFNFTPRGNNHGKEILDIARSDPEHWYSEILTVDDTHSISQEALAQEKHEMNVTTGNDALFMQEYYCSFDSPIPGAYYGSQLIEAMEQGRVTTVPHEQVARVNTYWDLGVGDSTAIWFLQPVGNELRFIDYYETSGEGLNHYAKVLQDKGYVYSEHWAPHDIEVRELSSGKSRLEIARTLGIDFRIVPNLSVEDGINAGRLLFNKCWFDRERCQRGLDALKSYHKEFDEKNKMYRDRPEHDWSSHGADAFRYFAVSYQKSEPPYVPPRNDLSNRDWSLA